MDKAAKKDWWQRSWMFPASLLLHVLIVGAFYLQWPQMDATPAEPESVSVELVEPPKEEPPPPPEEKAEQQEPPAPPAAQKEPPPPTLPNVAIRPDKTQLDERDAPAQQLDEGGVEEQEPGEATSTVSRAPEAQAAAQETEAAAAVPDTPASQPSPVDPNGELIASENQAPQAESVAVPIPKPDRQDDNRTPSGAEASGEGDPELKPAKKILASGSRPRPMLRQIMGDLPPRQRVAQLCIAETMAQIKDSRGAYTGLKPHTGKDFPVSGNVMNARGAFNVGPQWFAVNYRCEVDIDNYIVTDFRFHIGEQLKPDDVKRLGLPEG